MAHQRLKLNKSPKMWSIMFHEYPYIAGVPQKKHPQNTGCCRQIVWQHQIYIWPHLSLKTGLSETNRYTICVCLHYAMGNSLLHQPMEKTATYLDRSFGCCPNIVNRAEIQPKVTLHASFTPCSSETLKMENARLNYFLSKRPAPHPRRGCCDSAAHRKAVLEPAAILTVQQ